MSELAQRIGAFFDILSSRNVLIEMGAGVGCLVAGWMAAVGLHDRHRRRRIKEPTALTWNYFATQGSVVILPVVMALFLVVLARNLMESGRFDVSLLDGAVRLIGAYIVVRLV